MADSSYTSPNNKSFFLYQYTYLQYLNKWQSYTKHNIWYITLIHSSFQPIQCGKKFPVDCN